MLWYRVQFYLLFLGGVVAVILGSGFEEVLKWHGWSPWYARPLSILGFMCVYYSGRRSVFLDLFGSHARSKR